MVAIGGNYMSKRQYLSEWSLHNDRFNLKAQVPGDITMDFYRAGLIKNPYVEENYKDAAYIGREDFVYECHFDVGEEAFKEPSQTLVFESVDLFSDVYLNGEKIGATKNAFLEYRFDVSKNLKKKDNVLTVHMHSTILASEQIDTTGYAATFNVPRIFLRKPQCHFGWDWAPKICAYGLAGKVYLESKDIYQITDVYYRSDDEGRLNFFIETNYFTKDIIDNDGNIIKKGAPEDDDRFIVKLAKHPGDDDFEIHEFPAMGKKNFLAIHYKDFEKWWPQGYGKQPLYDYVVELYRGDKKVDEKRGKFAFRKVGLLEEGKENGTLGMDFLINGKKIFLKGSNWVPPECFTGEMKEEKYERILSLASDMNVNILRVWGGGSYESDYFYDYCDRHGIMVWQDVCLACADIPEDDADFVHNLLEEVEYQVKRLRNHPSIIYWCGGNEKTGTYGNVITHGDFLVNQLLYGTVYNLDDTRPYRRQSPHSYTDIGNDWMSGDSHHSSFETALEKGMATYREQVAENIVPFESECAVMGPSSEETMRKIFGEKHLWPMDEVWKDRLMENPYAAVLMDFPHRELYYAENLYGEVKGFHDFIKKAMLAHAEALKCESEFTRAHKNICGAFLNWMFDDIWPSGTWSLLDYYLEPKEAYYALRKSFAPRLASFYLDKEGTTHLFFDNATNEPLSGSLKYGVKKIDGTLVYEKEIAFDGLLDDTVDHPLEKRKFAQDEYLFVSYSDGEKIQKTIYSPQMWREFSFDNDFEYHLERKNEHRATLTIKAKSFVKSLFIHFPDNYKYLYSDNYLDLEMGDEVQVDIECVEKTDFSSLCLEAF